MKKIFILLMLIPILILSSCNKQINIEKNYSISESDISDNEFIESVNSYTSEVTSCYKDRNGFKHLFIYSNPIRYHNGITYKDINIGLKKNQYEGYKNNYQYIYENDYNASLFPNNINKNDLMICNDLDLKYSFKKIQWYDDCNNVEFKNFIGKKIKAIKYSSSNGIHLYTYPSAFGIENEFIIQNPNSINDLELVLKCKEAKKDRECIQIINGFGEVSNMVQNILLKDDNEDPNITSNINVNLSKEGSYYLVKYSIDKEFLYQKDLKYPLRLYLPINYIVGSLPDKSVYSNKNVSYLDNYFIIGKEHNWGFGKCYKRFVINDLVDLNSEKVIQAKFYMYTLSNISEIQVKEVLENWCSITAKWNDDIKIGECIFSSKCISAGEFMIDITKQCKDWLEDSTKQKENNGVVIFSNSNQPTYVLSNDNSLYNSKIEIIFK